LAVAAYFCFPSVPKVSTSEPFLPNNKGLVLNGGNGGLTDVILGKPFTLSLDTATNITVESPSYINVGISKIEARVFIG
jgi:hypothetical protein